MYETGFSRTDEIGAVHCKMARAGLALTIRGLAEITGLDKATIVRFEAGQPARRETVTRIRAALEKEEACFLLDSEERRIVVAVERGSSD